MLEREKVKSYENFNVAVYIPVYNILQIKDFDEFDEKFQHIEKNMKVGRVYIENFRGDDWVPEERLLEVKAYFEKKGIATSGGITPVAKNKPNHDGFESLCYSSLYGNETLRKAVEMNARVFDEMIFDDFFFLSCKCPDCVKKKGKLTWTDFRLQEKKRLIEECIMGPAKKINPNVNVILKYPQWFEVFNELGYDLGMEPEMFDTIYTGTETRNPMFSHQHLPKYLSYFTMRLYESAKPGKNLGGWFDPYDCTYNMNSYLEQCYLTLFGKAKEVTLFCLGSILKEATDFRLFAPAIGEVFREADEYLGAIGAPVGIPAYYPHNSRGEDNIHSYLGMIGFPTEPTMSYPENAKTVFLAEGALKDPDLDEKMEKTLMNGGDIIVTSNFVRKMGLERMRQFTYVEASDRKAMVQSYGVTGNHAHAIAGEYMGKKPVLLTQMDYGVNDLWNLAAAWGEDNNFPIVLRTNYGEGRIAIITIPDDYGDLYNYPREVLNVIRSLGEHTMTYELDAPSRVQMFVYDNDKVIIRSNNETGVEISLKVPEGKTVAKDLVSKRQFIVTDGRISMMASPNVNYVLDIQ